MYIKPDCLMGASLSIGHRGSQVTKHGIFTKSDEGEPNRASKGLVAKAAVCATACPRRNPIMSDVKKCAHPACSCVPAENHTYCSQVCQDAKNVTELVCQCDHPGCRGEALKP
jgi:hypothetical protein